MNTEQGEQSSPAPAKWELEFNIEVRCALCRRVGFVARYCPCTEAGKRRLLERTEQA